MAKPFSYSLIFLATVIVVTIAAITAWPRRRAPGGVALFWMMVAVLVWNLAGLLEVATVGLPIKIFWSKVAYLGAHTTPPLFLLFTLEYTHNQKWLRPRNIALLFLLPALTILLAATNELHQLIWTGFTPSPAVNNIYIYQHGVWFWVATVYVNIILFTGTLLFFRFVLRSRALFRAQNVALLLASLFPWVGFVFYLAGINPAPGLDLTAICFAFTGGILVFLLTRLQFLDIIPIAREFLVENLLDGSLVLDEQDRLVDINPAALRILNIDPARRWIGQPMADLLPEHADLARQSGSAGRIEREWVLEGPEPHTFDLQISPLYNRAGRLNGKSIIFRDVTQHKNSQQALQQANQQLAEKLAQIEKLQAELREQAIRDTLTGLFNRRYMEEIFAHELAEAIRRQAPLSVVIIDIDHFKAFNDTYGHPSGDDLLRTFGGTLKGSFRAEDIACRYGGDEFLLILPDSSLEDTCRRVEALRQLYREQGGPAGVTFSAGVAAYPLHAKSTGELLKIADRSLYDAKLHGRNRTSFH